MLVKEVIHLLFIGVNTRFVRSQLGHDLFGVVYPNVVGLVYSLMEEWIFRADLSLGWKKSFLLLALVLPTHFKDRVKPLILLIRVVYKFLKQPVLVA